MTQARSVSTSIGLAAILCVLAPAGARGGDAPAQPRTIKGELIDMRCYLTADKHGADHAKCAMICAKDNLPVGILTSEGKLYTLIVQPAPFADYMALEAEVTGTLRGETIVPDKARALKEGKWVEIKLPEQMM